MIKILIVVLTIALGISIFVNFSLIQSASNLDEEITKINSKNTELENQITSLNSKINILQTKVAEPAKELTTKPKEIKTNSNNQIDSISTVAVRPTLIRDGFFQNVQYEGTVMNIELSISDGSGLVLVNTEIPTGVDFQSSAKIAVGVAENYLSSDLSETDIIFSITADENQNLQAVDGQSAGAAMTILLISSLQGLDTDENVIITGTINSDMTIGMVGGIVEKSQAAGKQGAKIFLVPNNQGVTFVEECSESRTGNFVYRSCTSEQKPLSPMTEEKYGMKTVEVNDISEALLYFQGNLDLNR